MVLTKDELLGALGNEVRILLHLVSKADATTLDYRPTPKQRSTLELLQYLAIMPGIHLRGVLAESFDVKVFGEDWRREEAAAKSMTLDQARDAIGRQPRLFDELIGGCSDAFLRDETEMFGSRSTRGAWIVSLLLLHYAAYRMQLFLYLKASGHEELNTLNLWVGQDSM